MSSKQTGAAWIIVLLPVLSLSMLRGQTASHPQTASHAMASTQSGVYTAEQSQRGKALYEKQCATCHQSSLQGKGQNPPLIGDDFLNNWQGQTMADLFTLTQSSMPATNPGSLSPTETAQLLAYILNANGFPSGTVELPTDLARLKTIHIVPPQTKP